jgi:F-type H+-transporting ATPase subunit a
MTSPPLVSFEPAPVSHPVVSVCGSVLCQLSWDSLVSSAISIVVTVVILAVIANRVSPGVPGKLQVWLETIYGYARGQALQIDEQAAAFIVPLAMTIFLYILVANWLDFLPVPRPFHPANSDLNQTAAMGVLVFLVVQWYGIRAQGLRGYLRRYTKPFDMALPVRIAFVPLNIIEELAKPLTLSLRLFGNIFAGIVMLWVLSALLPLVPFPYLGTGPATVASVILIAVWKAFDVGLIGLIQAFIFMLLTLVYFEQAREGLEHEAAGGLAPEAAAH